ncbi:MAG: NrfD/PsrC family molybdoenzyme membrane anchor subunit, partial [Planctomycetota bacterium]
STPLMPIIFLLSAIVSGIAMLTLVYQVTMWATHRSVSTVCMKMLLRYLWYFLIIAVCLELLEIVTLGYEDAEEWAVIAPLLTDKLAFSFLGLQMILGALIPLVLLTVAVLLEKYLHDRTRNTLAFITSSLLLVQVLAMRWNVVIGGQLFSKSFSGYREAYRPEFLEKEGIGPAILIMVMPFVLMAIIRKLVPIFRDLSEDEEAEMREETTREMIGASRM